MIDTDEDALVCDLAETYHIYDYRSLPLQLVATLSCGLGDNSRIKRKMSGRKVSLEVELMSMIVDGLNWLVWSKSKDAERGHNKPTSLHDLLTGVESAKKNKTVTKIDAMTFSSVEELDKFMNRKAEIHGGD